MFKVSKLLKAFDGSKASVKRSIACECAVDRLEERRLLSSVTQYHNDASSSGQNLTEITLNPTDVNATSFGKLFSQTVDGQVYAQPLYVPAVNITSGNYQGFHNVTYIATENDSLYAIDAKTGTVLWTKSFLVPEPGLANVTAVTAVSYTDVNTTDINPIIGITSTPVIDGQYLFLTAKTKQIVSNNSTAPHFVYTLYKVDIGSGAFTGAVIGDTTYNTGPKTYVYNSGPYVNDPDDQGSGVVQATINGVSKDVVYFNALRALNRSALTLYNGSVYIAFASHGDNPPYHGWILGYSESSLAPTAVFNANPDGSDDGIWEGGGAIAIDPQGYMYVETGNGTFDTTLTSQGFPIYGDYGDSFIKIALDNTTSQTNQNINGWGLKVVDYFTPQNQAALSSADQDLGSGGPMVLPEMAGSVTIGSSAAPDLLVGSGKGGTIYLINRNNMGKFSPTTDNIVQELGSALGGGGSFDTPSFYYDGTTARIYYGGKVDHLRAFTISNGYITPTSAASPDSFGLQGATLSITANGASDGIVWGIDGITSQLRAYNASNVAAGAIYSTATNPSRDALGTAVKFTVPTIADGEAIVGTTNSVVVYGLEALPTSAPTAPNTLKATAVSNVQINLSWVDTATNAFGYYVEASGDGGNTWSQVATVSSAATSDSVTGLQPGTNYTFRVRAYNSVGDSDYSGTASAMTTNTGTGASYSSGFAGETGLTLNGSSAINGPLLQLTNGGTFEAASAFTTNAVSVQGFNTTFTFQMVNPSADGMTFILQGVSPSSIGSYGGGLGYSNGSGNGGIPKSVAIKFDLFNNSGEGNDSTGLFINGDSPTVPSGSNSTETSIDLTSSGINLSSGDPMQVNLTYDGVTLAQTITDTVTHASFSHNYAINIPLTVGSGYAYVGFGAGTGSQTVTANVDSWTYAPVAAKPYTPINFVVTPASGNELDLSWGDPYSTVTNYNVLELINGSYMQIGQVGGANTFFASTGLNMGQTYSYEVAASNSAGLSSAAGPVAGTTPTPPADAQNLVASNITTSGVTLTWQDVATDATGYKIIRQLESDNSQYVTTLSPTTTTFTDSNLLPGRAYDYEVAAYNLAGPGAGIDVDIQTVPIAPTVASPDPGNDQITLNWTAEGHAVTEYNIYRGTSPGQEDPTPIATDVPGDSYTDTNRPPRITYYYEITAVDTGGESAPSVEVSSAAFDVPEVTNVLVSSSQWSSAFLNYLPTLNPENVGGYSIPTGAGQATTLSWTNVDQVQIKFNENVVVSPGALQLIGVNVQNYGISGMTYNSTTDTATWSLSQPIAADKLEIDLNDTLVKDTSGKTLDGEWVNGSSTFPSGDGAAGGPFQFSFNVLPGDVNGDNSVLGDDLILVRNDQFTSAGSPGYSISDDVNGDGSVLGDDVILTRNLQFTYLPTGSPVLPATHAPGIKKPITVPQKSGGSASNPTAVHIPSIASPLPD